MASSNLYVLLQLEPTATHEEIVTSYRRLAQIYHPDKNPGFRAEATERFQQIQQAYQTLSNPTTRARYDSSIGRDLPRSNAMGASYSYDLVFPIGDSPNSFHMNRVRYSDGSLGPFAFRYGPGDHMGATPRDGTSWQRDDGGLARDFAVAQAARAARAARTDQADPVARANEAAQAVQSARRAVQSAEKVVQSVQAALQAVQAAQAAQTAHDAQQTAEGEMTEPKAEDKERKAGNAETQEA
ncbi:hypothetical protein DL769_010519 [Monosporascus sp. CRB-8-3]|nr:hypothetical protein DL769_010519 [Monosporascus sp. CRB-8-3]